MGGWCDEKGWRGGSLGWGGGGCGRDGGAGWEMMGREGSESMESGESLECSLGRLERD